MVTLAPIMLRKRLNVSSWTAVLSSGVNEVSGDTVLADSISRRPAGDLPSRKLTEKRWRCLSHYSTDVMGKTELRSRAILLRCRFMDLLLR